MMVRTIGALAAFAFLGPLLVVHGVRAEDRIVTGADAPDTVGDLPAQGGEDAFADLIDASDPTNSAIATGGDAGDSDARLEGGNGGDAIASIVASSPTDLSASAVAVGGKGSYGSLVDGIGGNAQASVVATNNTDASIDIAAEATGGKAPFAGQSGLATLGTVFGSSTGGGDVSVTGKIVHQQPGGVRNTEPPVLPLDAVLIDAVDGETSGNLSLTQQVYAADSEGGGTAPEIHGGHAVSELTNTASSLSLLINVLADAGDGGRSDAVSNDGGDATALADGFNDAGSVRSVAFAAAGPGDLSRSGDGGSASVEGLATTGGDGQTATVSIVATGGDGGSFSNVPPDLLTLGQGAGGAATATGTAAALGDSAVFVDANATAGDGGRWQLGAGGEPAPPEGALAVANGTGSNRGTQSVFVRARSTGGDGASGRGGADAAHGGVGQSNASAISTGGGDATAIAEQTGGRGGANHSDAAGNGADSVIDSAASGSTSGRLLLDQRARGGDGGGAFDGGLAGNAVSILTATNPGGGVLELRSNARGGVGGSGDPNGESAPGGAGFASAYGTTDSANLIVRAEAEGGRGGRGSRQLVSGNGGQATLGIVRGVSNTGDVGVIGVVQGGPAGLRGFESEYGQAAPASLVNAVDGQTAGKLGLAQEAWGGNARNGADAHSSLTREDDMSSELGLNARAFGGDAELGGPVVAGHGGNATALADGTTSNGGVRILGLAQGGSAAGTGHGGDAQLTRRATTLGEGHGIYMSGKATGGNAASVPQGMGGDGWSHAEGIAHGDSTIFIYDQANGGNASGFGLSRGVGGSATSTSIASGAGTNKVEAISIANGGLGALAGASVSEPLPTFGAGRGGDANASAQSVGLGRVVAEAHARAGLALPLEPNYPTSHLAPDEWANIRHFSGSASAQAQADGASGIAEAEAFSNGGIGGSVRANTSASVKGSPIHLASHTSQGGELPLPAPEGAQAYTAGSLLNRQALASVSALGTDRFGNGAAKQVVFAGSLAAFVDEAPAVTTTFNLDLSVDFEAFVESGESQLQLEFLNANEGLAGVKEALFEIYDGSRRLHQMLVTGSDDAGVFVDGLVLDLGLIFEPTFIPAQPGSHPPIPAQFSYTEFDLSFVLKVTVDGADQGFGLDFLLGYSGLVVIPEPSSGLLVVFGLVLIGATGHRGRRHQQ